MKRSVKEFYQRGFDQYGALDHPDLLAEFRQDLATHMPSYVEVLDLLLKHREAQRRLIDTASETEKALAETRAVLDTASAELRKMASVERENEALRKSDEAKTADLRKLRDQLDEDKIQLRILYAVDEACAARDAEIKALRAEIVNRDSRISELERSKKKLREAMSRLSEQT